MAMATKKNDTAHADDEFSAGNNMQYALHTPGLDGPLTNIL